GPDAIFRGVRLPLARIFTLVPPTSMTNTLRGRRDAPPSSFTRGGVHCRPDVLLVMSSSHFRSTPTSLWKPHRGSTRCAAGPADDHMPHSSDHKQPILEPFILLLTRFKLA